MAYTQTQDQPIIVNLLQAAKDTGWTIAGNIASHSPCNSGSIKIKGEALIAGHAYEISYSVLSISGGYVQIFVGTTGGVQHTTAGLYVLTVVATSGDVSFFSNATCSYRLLP